MSTTERDYYELLGVARDADEQTIKKAFRRLARQLHPDVSQEPEAELRFREVTEAYEVLSNSETRAVYDRFGHAGLRSCGFQPTNFDMGGLSDLFAAFFGDDLFGGALPNWILRRDDGALEITDDFELAWESLCLDLDRDRTQGVLSRSVLQSDASFAASSTAPDRDHPTTYVIAAQESDNGIPVAAQEAMDCNSNQDQEADTHQYWTQSREKEYGSASRTQQELES